MSRIDLTQYEFIYSSEQYVKLLVQRHSGSDLIFKTQLGEREPDLTGMCVLDAESNAVGNVVSRFGQGKWKAAVPS